MGVRGLEKHLSLSSSRSLFLSLSLSKPPAKKGRAPQELAIFAHATKEKEAS